MLLFAVMFFATNIVSAILLGINWRRLNKPQWTLPTILIPIVCVALGLGSIFLLILNADDLNALFAVAYAPIGAAFGFLVAVALMQNGAFKKWQETSDIEYVYDHEYDLQRGVLITVGVTVAMSLFVGLVILTS